MSLRKHRLKKDPLVQFKHWLDEHEKVVDRDFNAVTLGTSDLEGLPSSRIVLIKEIQDKGCLFYTNYASAKGHHIDRSPHVSLLFFDSIHSRQVHLKGVATKITRAKSELYFNSRPRATQLGTWASNQSEEIPGRDYLENRLAFFEAKFRDKEVPCPTHWGGIVVAPITVEFWQGRHNRLHDRMVYRNVNDVWEIARLSP